MYNQFFFNVGLISTYFEFFSSLDFKVAQLIPSGVNSIPVQGNGPLFDNVFKWCDLSAHLDDSVKFFKVFSYKFFFSCINRFRLNYCYNRKSFYDIIVRLFRRIKRNSERV